jgi:hypothetical protein
VLLLADDGEEDNDAVIAMLSNAESKREDCAPNTGFSLNLAHAARRQDDASNNTVQDADSAISQQETQVLVSLVLLACVCVAYCANTKF